MYLASTVHVVRSVRAQETNDITAPTVLTQPNHHFQLSLQSNEIIETCTLHKEMMFAHSFDEALHTEGYPKYWVDTAISYRRSKKCIKDVQKELEGLGLDRETMSKLF